MPYDYAAQVTLNQEALADPQPGDYWHEMFDMVLLVVKITGSIVWYVDEDMSTEEGRWTFNPTQKPKMVHKDVLSKRLRYDSETMGDKTWADVQRNVCAEHVKFFEEKV